MSRNQKLSKQVKVERVKEMELLYRKNGPKCINLLFKVFISHRLRQCTVFLFKFGRT